MNLTRNCLKLSAVMLACTGALVGCGGGGSSSTPTQTTGGTTTPATGTASTLVTSVPPASYSGSAADAYNRLNAERQACGFGLLAQNSSLDAAAAAHSFYEVTNNIGGHSEVPGAAGFTGVSPQDRANITGYVGVVGETMWIGNTGDEAMRGLLSGVYHMFGVLGYGFRDIGLSFRVWPVVTPFGTFNNSFTLVTEQGIPKSTGQQLQAAGDVLTYPCNGSTGVNRLLRGESPNPVPGRDIGAQPLGTPVGVFARPGSTLVVTSASVAQVGGSPVALLPIKSQVNDPDHMPSWQVSIIPDMPLAANAQYQVKINGTTDGVPFSKDFKFTTGANL